MKKNIIKFVLITICIIAIIIMSLVMFKQKGVAIPDEDVGVRNYVVYDNESNIIYDSIKEDEITNIEKDIVIMGLVELHHNGFIYIFGGQHFGELGYEIEEYTTSNIDDTNQVCIDYLTLEMYDTSYIEEGDLIICSGDLIKGTLGFNNDFNTKGAITVLKADDYNKMKKDALNGNRKIPSTITAGDIYKESGHMYLKYDLEDDIHSDTSYHFPFIEKAYITNNTEIIGNLQKGKKVRVQYSDSNYEIKKLELIEVIE